MFLAVDVGNTSTKIGLFRGAALVRTWTLSSDARATADERALLLERLLGPERARIERVGLASVVPALEPAVRESLARVTGRAPIVIDHGSKLGFTVGYEPPDDVGPDRLVATAAAMARYGPPVVVVDLGTAVTIDVLDRRRVYRGGIIAPGLELAAEALFRRTARLPQVSIAVPRAGIGRTTRESIRSGLVYGCAAMVDGLLDRVFAELKDRPAVVATGGAARLIAPLTRHRPWVVEDLTLEGIRLVAGPASRPAPGARGAGKVARPAGRRGRRRTRG